MSITVDMTNVNVRFPLGLEELGAEAYAAMRLRVQRAFDISQELVHVRSGRLKNSGRVVEDPHDPVMPKIYVEYGGEEYGVDYAAWVEYEYPYLEPAFQQARTVL